MADSSNLPQLSTMILAVGALGTAAFGLVDAFKVLPGGGVSYAGFSYVRKIIEELLPQASKTGLTIDKILWSLKSQWINGAASIGDQVNIAKSLVKLQLTPDTAPALARATGSDPAILAQIAVSMQNATPLSTVQSDVYGRFDLALTTLLDQAYQRGEQRYRNTAKFAAVWVAVALSLAANYWAVPTHLQLHWSGALLLGLVATPIAPVAKDIASAVQTASKAIQAWKS